MPRIGRTTGSAGHGIGRTTGLAETGIAQRQVDGALVVSGAGLPETVGFALADSPDGQAAWIYDKFQSKTDNHGLAEDALSVDDMLDAISLYWFINSAASSGRTYWENKSGPFAGPKLTLPVAVTVFPRDIPRLPRSWIEGTYTNLIHYGEADKGPRRRRRARPGCPGRLANRTG